jgi:hypothetical protein
MATMVTKWSQETRGKGCWSILVCTSTERKRRESMNTVFEYCIALENKKDQPPLPVQKAIQVSDTASNDGSDADALALIE